MSVRPTLQELIEVQRQFRLLQPSLVEKDWFVVRALAAIAAADKRPFQLVFQGGTALSRAHRLIDRMSEDIDFKVISEGTPSRGALRRLRESITAELLKAGFKFDPKNEAHRNTMYEGRYTVYRLPYEPLAGAGGVLRPQIQIEVAAFVARRPPDERSVISFVSEAFKQPPEVPTIACTAVVETVAEKFVALTRRAGAEFSGLRRAHDPTLVRHIYDLHIIREHYDLAETAALALEVMKTEAATRAAKYPAYRDDPVAETLRAVASIAADPAFASDYAAFLGNMVYGEGPNFETAVATLKALAETMARLQET